MGSVFYFIGTASAARRKMLCSQMTQINTDVFVGHKHTKPKAAQRDKPCSLSLHINLPRYFSDYMKV